MAGVAGGLLVFTGLWHMFEWMMGGRNRDTLRLIVPGLIYVVLGYLIVNFIGGQIVLWTAMLITAGGMTAALIIRKTAQVRPWVLWAFILIDVVIVLCLAATLLL